MPVLQVQGRPPVPVEVARTFAERSRGLLGRDGVPSALAIVPASSVHTFRMRFAIDVAFVRKDGTVAKVVTMRPNRMGAWRPRARWVLEAEPGWLAAAGVVAGAHVELQDDPVSR